MNWQPPGKYAQVSACNRYSVAKIGFDGAIFYESWRTRTHEDGPRLIRTRLPTAEAARLSCEADAVEESA